MVLVRLGGKGFEDEEYVEELVEAVEFKRSGLDLPGEWFAAFGGLEDELYDITSPERWIWHSLVLWLCGGTEPVFHAPLKDAHADSAS